MTTATLDAQEEAIRRVRSFARYGEPHLLLACHAAFPMALTPDLVYQIWAHFVPEAPWIAVAQLLLSSLCYDVGGEFYEMDLTIRNLLLRELKADGRFGQERLEQLGDFLRAYLHEHLTEESQWSDDLREAQEWTVLAYTKPGQANEELLEALTSRLQEGQGSAVLRLGSLIETLAEPLIEAGYQSLVEYAQIKCLQVRQSWKTRKPASLQLSVFEFETVTVNRKGEIIKREQKEAKYFTEDLGNGVSLEMVYIPGGEFLMGSPEGEEGEHDSQKPQHRVKVQPYFMSKYPITQEQWEIIAKEPKRQRKLDPNPSKFKGKKRPVERVNWYDTMEWCARLSAKTEKAYSLPSEAQWEYGSRGGKQTPFHYGETLTSELANYNGNYTYAEEAKSQYRKETTEVGKFPPNAFGLYDCHGNVWEWCLDPWHENYEGAPADGSPLERE